MDVLVGIDAGGSHTRVRFFAPETGACSEGVAGPGNPVSVGLETAGGHLAQALAEARRTWTAGPFTLRALHAGIAGAGRREMAEALAALLAQLTGLPRSAVGVSHDLATAHRGAFGDAKGILVIAGTGSAAFTIDDEGREQRCGGWGHWLDDVGSGYWLGREALRLVVRAEDGRAAPTALREVVMGHFQLKHLTELPQVLRDLAHEKTTVAGLAPQVLALAERDGGADGIILEGAAELLLLAKTLRERFSPHIALSVCFAGGLIQSEAYTRHLRAGLKHLPGLSWQEPAGDALTGALALAAARRSAG